MARPGLTPIRPTTPGEAEADEAQALAPPPLSARRSLLHNKPFVALCGARAISYAGDQVAAIALVLLISKTHPATAVGGLLLAESLPMLLSTHISVLADRFDARRLMIGSQLLQGLIFAVITAWLPPYGLLLAFLVLASLAGTLLRSATQVAVQATVPDEQLMPANALLGTALYSAVILGPAIGGALAGLAGPRLALALDTATFILSAATLLLLPRLPRGGQDEDADAGGAAAALRFAMGDPVLRALVLSMAMMVAFAGVDNVALVFLVRDTLDGGAGAYGAAMAVFGAGMVLGSALIIRNPGWRPERILLGSFSLTAACAGTLSVAPSLAVVFPAQLAGGTGNGFDVAAQTTLVQRRTPPSMLGRMSGAFNSAIAVGFLVAYLGGGALVDATSPRTAFAVAAVGTVGAIVVARPIWSAAPTPST